MKKMFYSQTFTNNFPYPNFDQILQVDSSNLLTVTLF